MLPAVRKRSLARLAGLLHPNAVGTSERQFSPLGKLTLPSARRWDETDVVNGVVLKGAGGKAFCSGCALARRHCSALCAAPQRQTQRDVVVNRRAAGAT